MKKNIILIGMLAMVSMFVSAQSYFKDGVVWRTAEWTISPGYKVEFDNTSIDGTEVVDGYEALKMYSFYEDMSQRELFAYIRTDGDRVYFKKPGLKTDDWLLAYDFGLKPGDVCYVYSLRFNDEGTPMASYVKCREIEEDGKGGWTTMYIDEYKDEACTKYKDSGIWLKGLSALRGPKFNLTLGLDGGFTSLYEVSCNGDVVYYDDTASVGDNVRSGVGVHRGGSVLAVSGTRTGSPAAVSSANGMLLYKTTADRTSVSMNLLKAGLIVVKVDDKVFKIK